MITQTGLGYIWECIGSLCFLKKIGIGLKGCEAIADPRLSSLKEECRKIRALEEINFSLSWLPWYRIEVTNQIQKIIQDQHPKAKVIF